MNPNSGPVALLDWDGTLRRGQTMSDWVTFLAQEGVFPPEMLIRLRLLSDGYRGLSNAERTREVYRAFSNGAAALYAEGLKGVSMPDVAELGRRFAEYESQNIYTYVPELVALLQVRGITPIIVTGSAYEAVNETVRRIGISSMPQSLQLGGYGRYDGTVIENTGLEESKLRVARFFAPRGIAFAAGNSPADEPLLRAADCGLVVGREPLLVGESKIIRVGDPDHVNASMLLDKIAAHLSVSGRQLSA